MKAEHRKALQTNTLAQELGKVIEGFKKGPSRSTWFWLVLIAAAVAIFFVFRVFWNRSEQAVSERWVALDDVVFPEQLDRFLKDHDGTEQARLARFLEARQKLSRGLRDLGANPDAAREEIRAGTDLYAELLKGSGRVDLLTQEALWGAAKGSEALGDLEQATSYYERLVKEYPASALGKDAKKQLERLNNPDTKRDIRDLTNTLSPSKK
jgi:hypothetical protein